MSSVMREERISFDGSESRKGSLDERDGRERARYEKKAMDSETLSVKFDHTSEARLRMKIDLMILPTVSLLYLLCFIDRANIGNARLAGFETDLGLRGYDFNVVLTSFYISYIVFEIPCNILCKMIGPGWFIPMITLLFGAVSVATAFVDNMAQAAGVRFILGLLEAGMLPGIAYYLSRWYRRSELAFRLSVYIAMAPLAGAFGGLLASGILSLSHFGSLHKWRMIFAIEGIITCGLALIGFVTLTDRPETATWLTSEEKDLAITRVKSERVGQTEVLDKLDTTKLLRGIFNPVSFGVSLIALLNSITVQGLAFFLPTIIKTIYPTKTVVQQQLQTVPPYIVGAFFTMLIPYISWRIDRRMVLFVVSAPFVMIGYIMFLASYGPHVRFTATFLIASGAFSFGALCNAQVSANVVSDTARASSIGMVVMFANVGGLISTWGFLPFDAPDYNIGNGLNLATSSTILLSSGVLWVWMVRDNKKREERDMKLELEGLSQKEIEDLDWKHPVFRWQP
ncbi:hypothetical protein AAF712_015475 [Marasmius tenuissimus]|uniref:Major facilitator superfamily (MFS) profile domain-containing protein n=1 Tax=Marasmius tenuissimus TaxID=585030 RepID=A0ABR2Z985_9AGAR